MELTDFLVLNAVLLGGGGSLVNTVAPAITPTAVIGTEITGDDGTWTGSPTFTYQWQRNTGSWVNIALATAKNYTPVDADFGYQLRLVVTANGTTSANSNATNLTQEAPAQALGAELLTNGNFAAWTGDDPDGWTVTGESGSDPQVTEVGGTARLVSSATNTFRISQNVLTLGEYCELSIEAAAAITGTAVYRDINSGVTVDVSSVGAKRTMGRAASVTLQLRTIVVPCDVTVYNATAKNITINTQLVAPSFDMRLDGFYTLPGSPAEGTTVWVLPRISDFSAGNYWNAVLVYTGSQWNINLYSVATFTRTSRIAATNIGATNGIRINMNADSISLYTTANGGTLWTQRGTTISNSTYQTATGVNRLWTSDVTQGNLVYAPAD